VPGPVAIGTTLLRYLGTVLPEVERQLGEWRIRADAIPDRQLRVQALASLSHKRFHCQGGSIFCAAPGEYRPQLLRFIVAYQTMCDYLDNLCDPPHAVGADRIANAVAAMHKYRLPAIIVDLGTAITFDVVSQDAEYLGGAITPGIHISLEALSARAAKLPRIELQRPSKAIGTTTEESMQSGVVFGAVGTVDSLVTRIKAELAGEPIVIATGGLAKAIASESEEVQVVDEQLTLDGLRLLYELNR
jgi:pantothenate kinase type III